MIKILYDDYDLQLVKAYGNECDSLVIEVFLELAVIGRQILSNGLISLRITKKEGYVFDCMRRLFEHIQNGQLWEFIDIYLDTAIYMRREKLSWGEITSLLLLKKIYPTFCKGETFLFVEMSRYYCPSSVTKRIEEILAFTLTEDAECVANRNVPCQKVDVEPTILPGESGMSKKCTALIGKDKASVCEELSLFDDSFIEKTFDDGMSTVKQKEFALGYDFDFSLLFSATSDQLYGYCYSIKFIEESEKAIELIELLLKLINNKYGEPDTYPELSHRITKKGNLERIQTVKASMSLFELWEIGESEDFGLDFRIVADGKSGIRIYLMYRLMPGSFPQPYKNQK